MKNKSLTTLVAITIGWRIALFVAAALAGTFLPYQPSFPYYQRLAESGWPAFVYSFANFDGVHYLTIVEQGYLQTGLIQAFFPGYPLVISLLNVMIARPIVSGLLVSNLCLVAVVIVFYQLISRRFSSQTAWWSTLALLLFPTSFFLGALYSESLFLLAVVLSWWYADRGRWWWAAGWAAVAAATRVVGVLVVPSLWLLILEPELPKQWWLKTKQWFWEPKWWQRTLKKIGRPVTITSLGVVGLLAYMIFLWKEFGDPLYFFHVQSEFGGGRQESLVLWPQVVWRYLKILITYRPFDWKYFSFVQEFLAGTVGFGLVLLSFKKVPLGWWLFALGAFLVPTLTGTFSSLPRYLLACLPLFVLVGDWLEHQSWLRWLWLTLATTWLVLNTVLFIQGYWVA